MTFSDRPANRRVYGLLALGLLAVCFALLVHYVSKATVLPTLRHGLLARGRDLGVLVVLASSSALLGSAVLERLRVRPDSPALRLVLSVALGLTAFYVAGIALAIAQWVKAPLLWLLAVLPIAVCFRQRTRVLDDLRAIVPRALPVTPISLIGSSLIALYALLALTPPSDIDALAYHLVVPRDYLQHGGATHDVANFYRSFPPAMAMLYMFAMGMGSELLPKLLHALCFALIALLCVDRFRRYAGKPEAALAVLFLAGQWSIQHAIERANIDFHCTLFTLCSLFLLLDRYVESDSERESATPASTYYALAGAMLGCAMASKITSISALAGSEVLLGLSLLHKRVSLRAIGWFHVAAFAVYSPTLVRNVLYGIEPALVPIADALRSIVPMDPEELERYRAAADIKPLLMTKLNATTLFATPLFAYRDGRFPNPTFDGYIDPFYLVTLLPGVFLMRRSRVLQGMYAYMAGFYVMWLATATVIRYALPVLPLLCFVTVRVFHALAEQAPERIAAWVRRGAHALVIGFVLVSSIGYLTAPWPRLVLTLRYFFEGEDRSAFLRAMDSDAVDTEELGRYVRKRAQDTRGPAPKVFMVFESQSYDLGTDYYNDPAYVNLRLLLRRERRGQDALAWLRAHGYDYVVTDMKRVRWLRNAQNDNPYISPYPEGLAMLDEMLDYWTDKLEPRLQALETFDRLKLYAVPRSARTPQAPQ